MWLWVLLTLFTLYLSWNPLVTVPSHHPSTTTTKRFSFVLSFVLKARELAEANNRECQQRYAYSLRESVANDNDGAVAASEPQVGWV